MKSSLVQSSRVCLFVMAFLLGNSGALQAGILELEFAKGVVAFSRGDLVEAKKFFEQVLQTQAEHFQASYYLGQVELKLGNTQKAISIFEQVLHREGSDPTVGLDLALALVTLRRFEEAENILVSVGEFLRERSSWHYYLGYCRYQLGHYAKALDPLLVAQKLDQGFGVSASYYLGLVYAKLGSTEQAMEQFYQLVTTPKIVEASDMAKLALQFLQEGPSRLRPKKWGIQALSGIAYDSNVTLDSQNQSHAAAALAFLAVFGFYHPYVGPQDRLTLNFNLYRNFHSTKPTQGYNLTDVSLDMGWQHKFRKGHQLELFYLADFDFLDGPSSLGMNGFGLYMQGHGGQGLFRIFEADFTSTSIQYRFRAGLFQEVFDARDYFGHDFIIQQDFYLFGNQIRLGVFGGMTVEDARHEGYDLRGPMGEVNGRFILGNRFQAWLQANWQEREHWKQNRRDRTWIAALGISSRLWDPFSCGLSYRFVFNQSTQEFFSYERHYLALALGFGW